MTTQRHFGNKLNCQTQRLPTEHPLPQPCTGSLLTIVLAKTSVLYLSFPVHVSREFGGEGLM